MNPIVKLILDTLIKYIQEHPDEVKKIVEFLIKMLLKWIEDHPIQLPK